MLHLEENLDALKTLIGELKAVNEDVMRKVKLAEQQQKTRLSTVALWDKNVEDALKEGDLLLERGKQEVRRLCLGGYCSVNCWSTSNFGKEVDKCLKNLGGLIHRGEQFVTVAEEAPRELVAELPCDATIGMEAKFNEVWSCLEKKAIGTIGLYGIGGVGKTTLLTQIRNKLVQSGNNLLVIWIMVGKKYDFEKLQADIGKEIDISIGSIEEKRAHIYDKLLKKRFVLLLDDIWERIKLSEIGIPPPEKLNGSKIIFTTRSLKVCGEMLAKQKIKIETLTWKHSWKLFKKFVGEDISINDPHILPLAQNVAKKCGGLPIALITIGRAMSCKTDPYEWQRAVEILRSPSLHFQDSDAEVLHKLDKEVFSLLKFSFDNLPNEKVKSFFLLSALFPNMYVEKDVLINYWIYEDKCNDGHESKSYREGYSIIGILKHSCLLNEHENGEGVRLHDVIRDMALWIERENALVMTNMGLTVLPAAKRWEGMRRVSLSHNKIQKVTLLPTYPKLATLLLSRNEDLDEIHEDFFQCMKALTVLDLYRTSIQKLPRSMASLVSLQYLDITSTKITELPVEMGKLVNLKHLSMNHLQLKAKKSDKVISSLSSLQVLYMDSCVYSYWEEEEDLLISNASGDGEILLEELLCLKHLSSLRITMRCCSTLNRFSRNQHLKSITKRVHLMAIRGVQSHNIGWLADTKDLVQIEIHDSDFEEIYVEVEGTQGISSLGVISCDINFNSLGKVFLDQCHHLRDLTWLILVPNLRLLAVSSCHRLEEIMSGEKLGDAVRRRNLKPLSKLEFLVLQCLPQLKCIYPNVLPFMILSKFRVTSCPLLKKLPLDSNSKEGCEIKLYAEEKWWEEIEWEDDATKAALLPRFRLIF